MPTRTNSYKKSGVNINLADKFVDYIAKISKQNRRKKGKSIETRILAHLDRCLISVKQR